MCATPEFGKHVENAVMVLELRYRPTELFTPSLAGAGLSAQAGTTKRSLFLAWSVQNPGVNQCRTRSRRQGIDLVRV